MSSPANEDRQPLLSGSTTRVENGASAARDEAHESSIENISRARRRAIVVATLISTFLGALDMTIVATCIPTISSELQNANREAWIGTAYLWSSVSFTPLYGRLSDLLGRRQAFLQAIYLFTLGTFLCGIANSLPALAVARFVAGMGGGGLGTVASVLIADVYLPEDRGFFSGISFGVMGAGMGLGGPLGGVLTQYFGWRAAFYAQLPLAAVVIVLAHACIPNKRPTLSGSAWREIDIGGASSLLLSIGSLLGLLSRTESSVPWKHDPISISLTVGFVTFLLGFIYIELRVAKKPVLPLTLLQRRTPLCVGIIAGLIAIVNFNMMYHLPMFFEIVLGQDLSVAGSHLLPNSAAMTVSAPIIGFLMKKTRHYKWLTVICCVGPVIAMALLSGLNRQSSAAAQWLSVLPMGAGFSGLLTATLVAMQNSVAKHEIATSTGFVFVWRSIGQVTGVGLSGAVFQTVLKRELNRTFDSAEIIERLRHASTAIRTLPKESQRLAARLAFGVALRWTFLFGLGGAVLVLFTSLFIENLPLRQPADVPIVQPKKYDAINESDDADIQSNPTDTGHNR